MTTNNTTTIDLEAQYQEETASKSRHIMAFTFGMVIPAIFATWGFYFVGLWVAGVVFCIYAFSDRSKSEAAVFGMFISAIAMILIIGGIEARDALDKPVEIYPAYYMR